MTRYKELEARVAKLERFDSDSTERDARDEKRFQNLATQIKDSADKLQKLLAAMGAKLDNQAEDHKQLIGRFEELEHLVGRMSAEADIMKKFLDSKFGLTVTALPPDLPKAPDKLYAYAEQRLKSGQYQLARVVCGHFLRTHTDHALADKARLCVGETYEKEKRWNKALAEYGSLYSKYADVSAKSRPPEFPEALWRAGNVLDQAGKCRKAKDMYRLLTKVAKGTPQASKAKSRVKRKCR